MSLEIVIWWVIVLSESHKAKNREQIVDEELIHVMCASYDYVSIAKRLLLYFFLRWTISSKNVLLLLSLTLLIWIMMLHILSFYTILMRHELIMHLGLLISRCLLRQLAFVICFVFILICISSKPLTRFETWHLPCSTSICLLLLVQIDIGVLS